MFATGQLSSFPVRPRDRWTYQDFAKIT